MTRQAAIAADDGEKAVDALHALVGLTNQAKWVLFGVAAEATVQRKRWGAQTYDDLYWLGIALEEMGEVAKGLIENRSPREVGREIEQVAAVLVSWLECRQNRAAR